MTKNSKKKNRKIEKKRKLLEKLKLDELDEDNSGCSVDINEKDEKRVTYSFFYSDKNKMKLSEWDNKETDILIVKLGYYSNFTWNQLRMDRSKFSYITKDGNLPILPQNIPSDIKLAEFKICKKKRIIGFINEEGVFCIIWFDRNHKTCS